MPWIWPNEVDAVRDGLRGYYGDSFDAGADRLVELITRTTPDPIFRDRRKREAVAYPEVAACAKVLVALSRDGAFSAGVIAMMAALLPSRFVDALPGDVETLRAKIIRQRDRHVVSATHDH